MRANRHSSGPAFGDGSRGGLWASSRLSHTDIASGQKVVVIVVVIVMKPVGQISVYDVTMTVMVISADDVGVAVTDGVAVTRDVIMLDPDPLPIV